MEFPQASGSRAMHGEIHETPLASTPGITSHKVDDIDTVQAAIENVRNKAEKFDDMSYARVGLILFRYVSNRIRQCRHAQEADVMKSGTLHLPLCLW